MKDLNTMKNKLYTSAMIGSSALVGFLCNPLTVFADNTTNGVLDYNMNDGTVADSSDLTTAGSDMQKTGKQIYYIVVAIALILVLGNFIVKAVKLAKSGDNPQARSAASSGLIWAMVAIALIGGAAVISGWAFGIFRS